MPTITPIPAFSDNYIWTLYDKARSDYAVAVDPGDALVVERFLEATDLRLAAILVTHHHADHTGGIAALAASREIAVYGPASEAIAGLTHRLVEGNVVDLDEFGLGLLKVLDVPGHTNGHIAYVGDDYVFCGDTLFAAGCGRLFEGTPAQMYASLAKLASLPSSTRVYCTHEYTLSNLRFAQAIEPDNAALAQRVLDEQSKRERGEPTLPSTILLERQTNPFLRATVASVSNSAARVAKRILASPVDVFAALREYKNIFR
jgi:hydroxyacylglutathione hydrolase